MKTLLEGKQGIKSLVEKVHVVLGLGSFKELSVENGSSIKRCFFCCCLQTKYTLIDERDIALVHEYTFEARTEIDRNGGGAVIFAFAYLYDEGRHTGQYVQNILW